MSTPKLSVVIPVYNEEAVLPTLFARLYPALDALHIPFEIVYVNDASNSRRVRMKRVWCCSTPTSASIRPSWPGSRTRAASMW